MSRVIEYDGVLRSYSESVRDFYEGLNHVDLLVYRRVDKEPYISILLSALENPLPILLDVASPEDTISLNARNNLGVVLENIVEQNGTFNLRLTPDMSSFLLLSEGFKTNKSEDQIQELKKIVSIGTLL